ncbi:hypothetical protein BT96DRAFT_885944 [Gymnopus androsaceus JB14]|uniref:MYND-type domain-containing protein n=1 Tax=Gymnopus androsaceus JB14 TaxID=1447944 RepID=A0A6A4HAI2_9AGAR|nr:hypothetical protein BT96DRAFT_885944 [Gymnopus androsaceus JB14]
MYGVIRFLDTDLLPASLGEDYPKVIKSGIDEEGQHHKSPEITGPCGIALLFYRAGRMNILEKLLDVKKVQQFDLRARSGRSAFLDVYLHRRGSNLEMGFQNNDSEEEAQHGVRYLIVPDADGQHSQWIPQSTSDLGSPWGGSREWVVAQGAAVTKAIWWHEIWNWPMDVSWSGMTGEEKAECKQWNDSREEERRVESESEPKSMRESPEEIERQYSRYYSEMRKRCRAECGEKNAKLACSKCKSTRYCSTACQAEDWKYHKTYCGTKELTLAQYLS